MSLSLSVGNLEIDANFIYLKKIGVLKEHGIAFTISKYIRLHKTQKIIHRTEIQFWGVIIFSKMTNFFKTSFQNLDQLVFKVHF